METPKSVDPIHTCGFMHPDTQACPTVDTPIEIAERASSAYLQEHWGTGRKA